MFSISFTKGKNLHEILFVSLENIAFFKIRICSLSIFLLKTLDENLNPDRNYKKTNLTAFISSLWEIYRCDLTSFGKYISIDLSILFTSDTWQWPTTI